MQVVICYDTGNDKLRYRLVKYLERMAVRIQYSVFYGDVEKAQIEKLQRLPKCCFKATRTKVPACWCFPSAIATGRTNLICLPIVFIYKLISEKGGRKWLNCIYRSPA